jgi:hypothetical protein
MRNSINWIGIDDHADKLTIAQYAGGQKQAAKEWEVASTEQGLRQLVRWLKGLEGSYDASTKLDHAATSCTDC